MNKFNAFVKLDNAVHDLTNRCIGPEMNALFDMTDMIFTNDSLRGAVVDYLDSDPVYIIRSFINSYGGYQITGWRISDAVSPDLYALIWGLCRMMWLSNPNFDKDLLRQFLTDDMIMWSDEIFNGKLEDCKYFSPQFYRFMTSELMYQGFGFVNWDADGAAEMQLRSMAKDIYDEVSKAKDPTSSVMRICKDFIDFAEAHKYPRCLFTDFPYTGTNTTNEEKRDASIEGGK